MDFKKHFETAWQSSLQFLGPVLIVTLVNTIVAIFSLGIMTPVTTAGYTQSLLRAQREGRTPMIGDLFAYMSLFLPLSMFFGLVVLAIFIGFLMLVLPGVALAFFVLFATLYMIPLMTDKEMGLMDALKESWAMAKRQPISDQIVISLAYLVVMSIGGSIPLAILVTQPFATFLILSVYEERLQGSAPSEQRLAHESAPPPPPPPPPDPAPAQ